MIRFTLITEGASENRIIKYILNKFFPPEELFFRDAQPQIINDKQETIGGWNEVLNYCGRTEDLKEIFNNTDYLVIQIDTDQSQTSPFNISHTRSDNTLKSINELHTDVINRFNTLINDEILELHSNQIIFAICVHTIECWLLPMYYTNNHRADTRNCASRLNVELGRRNLDKIPTTTKNKNTVLGVRAYEKALKGWRRKQDIINSAEHNSAFNSFIHSLNEIQTTEQ